MTLSRLVRRPGSKALLVTVAVLAACLVLAANLLRIKAQHDADAEMTAGALWNVARANLDLERLIGSLDAFALGTREVGADALRDRFDILWSRLRLLFEGAEGRYLAGATSAGEVAPDALAVLAKIDPLVEGLVPGDREALATLRARLVDLREPLSRLHLEANRWHASGFSRQYARISTLYWQHVLYQIVFLASSGVLILLLLGRIRAARETRLAADEARGELRTIIDAVPVALSVVDRGFRYCLINRLWRFCHGLEEAQVLGRSPDEPGFDSDGARRDRLVLETGRAQGAYEERRYDWRGTERVWLTRKVPILDPLGAVDKVVTVALEVTEHKAAQARIEHLALHDPLTDLPNRALLADRLAQAIRHAHRYDGTTAVLCLDLDNFHEINNAHGHDGGDALLVELARRMRAVVRQSDTTARIGGDEFALVLTRGAGAEGAVRAAEDLISALAEPFAIDGREVRTSVSIGICVGPQDGDTPERLLRNAELALRSAKAAGRGSFRFFRPEMNTRVQRRRELVHDLQRALADNGLEVHYQPKFALPERRPVGLEALVRWPHPVHGRVAPEEFIAIAEETGLITALGDHVLRAVCGQCRAWQEGDQPILPVAVNLSPAQFRRCDLVEGIVAVLEETGLAPGHLELEITENLLLQDSDHALAVLQELRGLGVTIALDDFGTGYSSLSYLHRFPIDRLKIDKSFVHDLGRSSSAGRIIETIVSLARCLHLKVVAEGVETAEQLACLEAIGCDEVQGYHLHPPQPAPVVTALLPRAAPPVTLVG